MTIKILDTSFQQLFFFQLLPLIPLWFEYMHTKDVSMDSYILCVSMYAFATGFSSIKEWMLGICFLIGILIAGSYKGQVIDSKSAFPFLNSGVTYCLLLIFIMHIFERWGRHINGKEPFFLFNLFKLDKMKTEILTYIAMATGFLGVILSVLNLYRKKKAEQNFENLLKEHKVQLEKIKSIGKIRNEISNTNRVMTFEEFVKVQETLKVLLAKMEEKERQEILESLEQKSIKGQVGYLNKLIHLSGSIENIVIKTEK